MTSELKPCPFCGDSKHLIIDDYHDPEMDGYFGFTVICNAAGWDGVERGCGASGAWGETKEQAVNIWNTRAVPDVPELVRYDLACDFDGKHQPDIIEVELGEYVRYDQAAAMLAAKDADIERLTEKAIVGEYMWTPSEMMEVVKRAEASEAELAEKKMLLQNERDQQVHEELAQLKAKLAQIKAQKIIGYFDGPHFSEEPREGWIPLYAAPVDQTAEIERLREALKVQREAAATYCWERYKNRPPLDLSDAACFTSHEWQKIGDAMDAAVAVLSGKEPS